MKRVVNDNQDHSLLSARLAANSYLAPQLLIYVGLISTWLLDPRTAFGEPAAQQAKPNLVFVIADDLTFRDLGCYGGQAHTPNIDGFAAEGMQFMQCFQSAPMCSPTRHNIYTGLYPVKSGAYPNHTFAKAGTRSVCHYLQPEGYRVALSGKTHISPKTVFPFEYLKGAKNPDMEAVGAFLTECKASGVPFCLFACSNEPHTPWNKGDPSRYPPDEIVLPPYLADTPVVRENFSRYLAEITYYDQQVGQILALLEERKLSDNTLVMVVSEQGNSMPFAKWTCYDHGLQSAMLVRWPGKIEPGSRTDALVEYTDVLPTFMDAAGIEAEAELDGKSFLPVLLGESDEHKDFTYGIMTTRGINDGSHYYGIRSVRDKRYRLIWNLHHETTFENACTHHETFVSMREAAAAGDKKAAEVVLRYQHRPEFELYDCERDPMQLHNLADDPARAEALQELKKQLQAWMTDQGDLGAETEAAALIHQGKYRGKTLEAADNIYDASRKKKAKDKKKKKSKA